MMPRRRAEPVKPWKKSAETGVILSSLPDARGNLRGPLAPVCAPF